MTTTLTQYYSADFNDSYEAKQWMLDINIRLLKHRIEEGSHSARNGSMISDFQRKICQQTCRIVSRLIELSRTGKTTIGRNMIWPDLAPVVVSLADLYVLSGTFMTPKLVYKEDKNTLIGIDGAVYHKCDICGEWTSTGCAHEFGNLYYCGKLGCEDAAMPSYYNSQAFAACPEMFLNRQAWLREEAISYQDYASGCRMSYGDIADAQEYFSRLGEKYDLLAEFQENGIC